MTNPRNIAGAAQRLATLLHGLLRELPRGHGMACAENDAQDACLDAVITVCAIAFSHDDATDPLALEAYARLLHLRDGKVLPDRKVERLLHDLRRDALAKGERHELTNDICVPPFLRGAARHVSKHPKRVLAVFDQWNLVINLLRDKRVVGVMPGALRASLEMQGKLFKYVKSVNRLVIGREYRDFQAREAPARRKRAAARRGALAAAYDRTGAASPLELKARVEGREWAALTRPAPATAFNPDNAVKKQIVLGRIGYLKMQGEKALKKPDGFEDEHRLLVHEQVGGDMGGLIGLSDTKQEFKALRAGVVHARAKKLLGLMDDDVEGDNYHLVFAGPPGTCKTTFARLTGQMYKDLGILPRGHVVEVTRHHLVGGYIGQTAPKTQAAIDRALGGVLFIDEAYQLYNDSQNDFGREALATLLLAMENERDRLVVIMAGYPEEMNQMLQMNPGLPSRVRKVINFQPYTADELVQIFDQKAAAQGLDVSDDAARTAIRARIVQAMDEDGRTFGNGRYIRSLVGAVGEALATRLVESGVLNEEMLRSGADFEMAFGKPEARKKLVAVTAQDVAAARVIKTVEVQKARAIGFGAVF